MESMRRSAEILVCALRGCELELNPPNRLGGIPVHQCKVTGRQSLQFGLPSLSGNFHAQHAILESESAGTLSHG
jgi:hypothetical protein